MFFPTCSLVLFASLPVFTTPPQATPAPGGPAHAKLAYLAAFDRLHEKLDQGAVIEVTYLGGSVTKGATTHPKIGVGPNGPYDYSGYVEQQDSWRGLSFEQLRALYEQYPGQLVQRNASLGATGSELAAHRFVRDVGPTDLLLCEFAINDVTQVEFTAMGPATDRSAHRTMLSVVRQARIANPDVAIVFVIGPLRDFLTGQSVLHQNYRESYETTLRFVHDQGMPFVDLVDAFLFQPVPPIYDAARLFDGPYIPAGNTTHPSPIGHAYYAETVTRELHRLIQLNSGLFDSVPPLPDDLQPYPLQARPYWAGPLDLLSTVDGWESEPNQENWFAHPIFEDHLALFARSAGSTLTVPFEGSAVSLWWAWDYDAGQLSGRVEVSLDGTVLGVFARPHRAPERPLRRFENLATGLDPDQPHELVLRVLPHDEPLRLALHGVLVDG